MVVSCVSEGIKAQLGMRHSLAVHKQGILLTMHENHQFPSMAACLPRKTHLLMLLENISPGLVNGTSTRGDTVQFLFICLPACGNTN